MKTRYTPLIAGLFLASLLAAVSGYADLASPNIATQPTNQVLALGGDLQLSVSVTGTEPMGYQWFKNGGQLAGATHSTLLRTGASVVDSGVYTVAVTNAFGMRISTPVRVTVGNPHLLAWGRNNYGQLGDGTTTLRRTPVSVPFMSMANIISGNEAHHTLAVSEWLPPVITRSPTNQTVVAGSTVTFTVAASGLAPLAYQWFAVSVGVAYGSDTRRVAQLLAEEADRHGLVQKEPASQVIFKDFGDNAMTFELRYWVDVIQHDSAQIGSDLRHMIAGVFAQNDIIFAFPQRDLHLDTVRPLQIRIESAVQQGDQR